VVLTEIIRTRLAHHICPSLSVGSCHASWRQAREMLLFGGKALVASVAARLLYQTTSILLAAYLGPAALALYARPLSLIRELKSFLDRFAFVLTAAASSLQAAGRFQELPSLFLQAAQTSAHLSLPPVLFLAILGSPILEAWMGSAYAQTALPAILALGHLATITQEPITSILMGLNRHGPVGLIGLGTGLTAIALSILALGLLETNLTGVALAITLPLLIADGICIPGYACRQLGLPFHGFFLHVWQRPVLCALPLALVLLAGRVLLPATAALTVGVVATGAAFLMSLGRAGILAPPWATIWKIGLYRLSAPRK
jgi:O-antigen/teichoic acid export membrane protein